MGRLRHGWLLVISLLMLAGSANAQTNPLKVIRPDNVFNEIDEQMQRVGGLRFDSVSLFAGYSTTAIPLNGLQGLTPLSSIDLGYDVDVGASAAMSWRRERRRNSYWVSYSPSAAFRARYPELNVISHNLNAAFNRQLSSRTRFGVSSGLNVGTFGQIFFRPIVLRSVTAPPRTIAELIAALQAGEITSEELASILTDEPIIDDPGGVEFSNSSSLNSTLAANLSFDSSRRTSVFVSGGYNYSRFLGGRDEQEELDARTFVNSTQGASLSSGVSYSLDRRTTATAQATVGRSFNAIGFNTFNTNYSGTINRTLGRKRNWTASANIGYGATRVNQALFEIAGRRWIGTTTGGASVSYRMREQSFTVGANRSVTSNLGLGAQKSDTVFAGWTYSPSRARWGLSAQAGYFRANLIGFDQDLSGRQASISYSRQLTSTTGFQAGYSYVQRQSGLIGVFGNIQLSRVQAGIFWGSLRRSGMPSGLAF